MNALRKSEKSDVLGFMEMLGCGEKKSREIVFLILLISRFYAFYVIKVYMFYFAAQNVEKCRECAFNRI